MINFFRHKINFEKAAILFSCLFFFSCENDTNRIQELSRQKTTIDEARDVTTFLSQDGMMKAKLLAPLMLRYQADTSYVEFPKTMKVDFFDSTAKVESKLSALYGKYYETRNMVYIRDSVVVYNIKGDTLWTTELWWDQNTQKFYTDKHVRIHRKEDKINGRGMEARQDLSDIIIKHPTGSFMLADSLQ